MTGRDWDKELADIDRQLSSIPDEALVRQPPPGAPAAPLPAGKAPPKAAPGKPAPAAPSVVPAVGARRTWQSTAGLAARLLLGVAALAAVVVWPYEARCGMPLAYYLGAIAAVVVLGLWTSVAAWKHRAPLVHVLGLLLVVAGAVFAADTILPRTGYAMPTPDQPAIWTCS